MSAKKETEKLLQKAGITINGPNGFDIQIFNEKFYTRVLRDGSMALGESYMDGWWDAKNVDQFIYKILSASLGKKFTLSLSTLLTLLKFKLFNVGSFKKAFEVGEKHYDVGNDLYKAMLDKRMVYTCAYWTDDAQNLDEAQEAKLDLVCRKLKLKKGDRVLDIGCGWGSFLKFAAKKYGIEGVGVTVSKEQVKLAKELCRGLPLEIKLMDYRALTGRFDYIVSLGMFEHVGTKNYATYFKKARQLLKEDGLFLLHTIGMGNGTMPMDPWIEKYIFPNGMLPSMAQIGKCVEGLFIVEDWHNFGADYDKTLMAWFENFDKAWSRSQSDRGSSYADKSASGPALKSQYSEKFYRMWKYYLLSCAAGFRARNIQLWQIVLSKNGVKGGYQSLR